jgi:hypothetical protein
MTTIMGPTNTNKYAGNTVQNGRHLTPQCSSLTGSAAQITNNGTTSMMPLVIANAATVEIRRIRITPS